MAGNGPARCLCGSGTQPNFDSDARLRLPQSAGSLHLGQDPGSSEAVLVMAARSVREDGELSKAVAFADDCLGLREWLRIPRCTRCREGWPAEGRTVWLCRRVCDHRGTQARVSTHERRLTRSHSPAPATRPRCHGSARGPGVSSLSGSIASPNPARPSRRRGEGAKVETRAVAERAADPGPISASCLRTQRWRRGWRASPLERRE